jgi:hypothetical protein
MMGTLVQTEITRHITLGMEWERGQPLTRDNLPQGSCLAWAPDLDTRNKNLCHP